jgi:hypothetical protein
MVRVADLGGGRRRAGVGDGGVGVLEAQEGVDGDRGGDAGAGGRRFAGFASGQLVAFQEMGFGIAIALALDATLVRLLLIPAAMRLLGERNWYLPSWLSWLPDLQVEGHQPPVPPADQPAHDDTAPRLPPGAVPVRS